MGRYVPRFPDWALAEAACYSSFEDHEQYCAICRSRGVPYEYCTPGAAIMQQNMREEGSPPMDVVIFGWVE